MSGRSHVLVLLALSLLAAGCGGADLPESGNVLQRLLVAPSQKVTGAERAVCQEAIPDALAPEGRPPVLATDRAAYREVIEAMKSDAGSAVVKTVPRLPRDAEVTLCLVDTSDMPAAPTPRTVFAVSGKSSWMAAIQPE
ncbi:hypothetical protein [Marmoricola sp. RAF53]|uniref:hypothetical protein n=1 Tax=Marmoricola sp. RAF53 TaxID=3233059 RepID=UPI003F968D11